jgi:hypothetical protein
MVRIVVATEDILWYYPGLRSWVAYPGLLGFYPLGVKIGDCLG